jgi:hypothetical protein
MFSSLMERTGGGERLSSKRISRGKLPGFLRSPAELHGSSGGMGGAHHWARQLALAWP